MENHEIHTEIKKKTFSDSVCAPKMNKTNETNSVPNDMIYEPLFHISFNQNEKPLIWFFFHFSSCVSLDLGSDRALPSLILKKQSSSCVNHQKCVYFLNTNTHNDKWQIATIFQCQCCCRVKNTKNISNKID